MPRARATHALPTIVASTSGGTPGRVAPSMMLRGLCTTAHTSDDPAGRRNEPSPPGRGAPRSADHCTSCVGSFSTSRPQIEKRTVLAVPIP